MLAFAFQSFQPLRATSKSYSVISDGGRRRTNVVLAVARDSAADASLKSKVETLMEKIKWDDKGLAVAIAQNVDTGAVLMQGFANRDALATTISSRKATFYSRSRSTLWTKGETSKNFINVHDIFLDCDKDSIIYLGKPDGPTCHTGSDTCYYTSVSDLLGPQQVEKNNLALTTLYMLEATIAQRKAESMTPESGKPSWTKKLLLDDKLLCSKIREEANELCQTLEDNEDKSRAASRWQMFFIMQWFCWLSKMLRLKRFLKPLERDFQSQALRKSRTAHL
ncbi:unnamed protein product [Rhodiola kirilowii]